MKYGFKIKYNKKDIQEFIYDNFEEAYKALELKLLEFYDSEYFTTLQFILNKYDIEDITEENFKKKLKLNNLNNIKNFNIQLFTKK